MVLTHRVARVVDLPEGRFLTNSGVTPTSRLTRSSSLLERWWAGSTASVPYVGFVLALLSMQSGFVFILAALGMLLVGIWLLEEAEVGGPQRGGQGCHREGGTWDSGIARQR